MDVITFTCSKSKAVANLFEENTQMYGTKSS